MISLSGVRCLRGGRRFPAGLLLEAGRRGGVLARFALRAIATAVLPARAESIAAFARLVGLIAILVTVVIAVAVFTRLTVALIVLRLALTLRAAIHWRLVAKAFGFS